MALPGWLALGATLAALLAMSVGRVSAERALAAALVAMVAVGVVAPERALAGFANQGMATVALLYVLASAIRRSGALSALVARLLGVGKSTLVSQLRLMLPVASLSAFMNNTPLVAMLLPELRRWGDERGIAPSYLFLPLSYAAIVGGMCTLIGTSTNLIVDGLVAAAGMQHIDLFWIAPVGAPAALVAIAVMAILGRRLLPSRSARDLPLADPREFTAEFEVEPDGPLRSRRLAEIAVPDLRSFAPVEIRRGNHVIAAPRSDQVLEAGDLLVFAAPSAEILAVHRLPGLTLLGGGAPPAGPAGVLVEAIVGPRCPLVGEEVGGGSFRRHYEAAVIAVARHGERMPAARVGTWRLEVGDTLLLEAAPDFVERHRYGTDLILVSDHGRAAPLVRWHGPFSLLALAGMATAAATGLVPMFVAALLAVTALLAAGVVSWQDAARDVEWRVLLAIAASFGLGAALEESGAASSLAGGLVALGGDSPWATLAMFYIATVITTEFVTNNAAAVLMFPIAIDAAANLGVSPWPFIGVLMIGASAGFLTPIGYQTNLMVYGAGGYRVGDFVRFGTPVAIAVGVVTLALAHRVWSF